MKSGLLLIPILAILAVSVFIAPAPAQAGDCYQDPIYDRTWSAHISHAAFVRDKACMEGSVVVTTLALNTKINIIAETDGWYKVRAGDGTEGWVGQWLIAIDSKSGFQDLGPTPTPTPAPTTETSSALTDRLKGYVLLQVEKNGEAWYVHPIFSKRYYMKDGPTAYEMMRAFGLGISNQDLARVKAGEWEITNRLKGRILLQVEELGEAYYIHPKTGEAIYMKDGEAAYSIMRFHSLGITNTDLNLIESSEFVPIK